MPAPYHSIEDRLNRYQTGLTNARDVPELQSRVALERDEMPKQSLGISKKGI